MKVFTEVQYNNHNVSITEIEKMVKEDVKASGAKITTIESLEIYYTPDTNSVYYVATAKDGTVISNDEPITIE